MKSKLAILSSACRSCPHDELCEEKVAFLSSRPGLPRLGIQPMGHGEEVVQLYVRHLDSAVERPIRELRGFKRVAFRPGERKTVEFTLPAKSLAYWDTDQQGFVVEPGKIELEVGSSSADIKLKKRINLTN